MRLWLVPVLACVVAALQMACAIDGTLTPWKGGGFGMFAVIDGPTNRFLAIDAIDHAGRAYRVVRPRGEAGVDPALAPRYLSRTLAFPSEARLRRIAEAVLRAPMVPVPDGVGGLPTRLRFSTLSRYLTTLAEQPALQIVGSAGRASPSLTIATVRVRVLHFVFQPDESRVQLTRLGPQALVHVAADSDP